MVKSTLIRRLRAGCLRLAGAFRGNRVDGNLSKELESHLEMQISENIASGMPPGEARRVSWAGFAYSAIPVMSSMTQGSLPTVHPSWPGGMKA